MTLCAWCGKQLIGTYIQKYHGELICWKCYQGRDKSMEEWQKSLDQWLDSEPEVHDSKCKCAECNVSLYPEEDYYDIDGDILCEECAREWLEENKSQVTDEMAYGE